MDRQLQSEEGDLKPSGLKICTFAVPKWPPTKRDESESTVGGHICARGTVSGAPVGRPWTTAGDDIYLIFHQCQCIQRGWRYWVHLNNRGDGGITHPGDVLPWGWWSQLVISRVKYHQWWIGEHARLGFFSDPLIRYITHTPIWNFTKTNCKNLSSSSTYMNAKCKVVVLPCPSTYEACLWHLEMVLVLFWIRMNRWRLIVPISFNSFQFLTLT